MPAVTEGLRRFLTSRKAALPGADLLERYLQWGGPATLETQVNVSSAGGEPVEGRRHTWTDGNSTWFNIRIPKNAMDKPTWDDYELRWAPEEHAEAIGSTGWDWVNLRSRWVGFDFDDITGHARGVGIADDELERVKEAAEALDYVEVRRSTGGKGLHLYINFDDEGIPTANHTEHAALARCLLGMMSVEVKFDFASAIDACGGNMWIWRSTITAENQGLKLLKPAARVLSIKNLPANWRDHIAVVTRRATKVKLQGVTDENKNPFEELTSARRIIPLDATHKAIIAELMETGYSTIWISDHHLLQTHTRALAALIDDAAIRSRLKLIGHFQTNSPGRDPGQPNCFLFPLTNGGWRVYRFSPGITEAETWVQDGNGWTTCYFNRLPDIETACRANGGQRCEGKPHYVFPDGASAIRAAEALGQQLSLPPDLLGHTVELRVNNGYLTVYLKQETVDKDRPLPGWIEKRGHWVKDLDKRLKPDDTSDLGDIDFDGFLRAMRSPSGEVAGWSYQTVQGDWSETSNSGVKLYLQGKGQAKTDAEIAMGRCIANPWKIVTQPFQDEYPGGRCWNQGAPQLLYMPAQLSDEETPCHPHWDLILNHVGTELTAALQSHPWAKQHGITTGGQYLLLWIAALFREPFQRLPYLFLHGNENCGKSIFYEAIQLLVTKGVVSANKALTTLGDFNGELKGAVLCYIEELDLAHNKLALQRIKDWVTSEYLQIRQMRRDAYQVPNTTHYVQVANARDYAPLFKGDTRIVAIHVPDLLPEQDIPKDEKLKPALRDEAPHFLHTLFSLTLPPAPGRLRIPVIETASKLDAIDLALTRLEQFVQECCKEAKGDSIKFNDFYEAFRHWLAPSERTVWSITRVSNEIKWERSQDKHTLNNMKLILPEASND